MNVCRRFEAGEKGLANNMLHPSDTPLHPLRQDLFLGLPPSINDDFTAIESRSFYAGNSKLFAEDQIASGIFVIHAGRVMLSTGSLEGKLAASRTAFPGEILGLAAAVSGELHMATARTLEPSQIGFVSRADLLRFFGAHRDIAFRVVRLLSERLDVALDHLAASPRATEA